jgi:hypothetical protein
MAENPAARFSEVFRSDILNRRMSESEEDGMLDVEGWEEAFTTEFLERLAENGLLPDLDTSYFNKPIGRNSVKVNAYGLSDPDSNLDLVVAICPKQNSGGALMPVPARDIERAADRCLQAYRASQKPVFREMEPSSPEADMFQRLYENRAEITKVRIVVLVEGEAKSNKWEPGTGETSISLDVWDYVRLHRISTADIPYESIAIDLMELIDEPLPVVRSDVSVSDHESMLTIFPGELLHDLYGKYGARLLELNVRSFLQARGKVNRGIRDTLLEDPEHFFAFNNGISVTVEKIGYGKREDGTQGIKSLTGLQIVNGGQTTASIHRAKHRDKADLSKIRVQGKITIVQSGNVEALVSNISRWSNSQNAVSAVDFSANHPYHVALQQLSERIWSPGQTNRWFYERARGQYDTERAREGLTPAKLRAFDARLPKTQKIDKTILARSEMAWQQKPHWVSRGGQKNFMEFMVSVGNSIPDESDYRNIIARVILYKSAEKTARQLKLSAYRANAVCYTVALLVYRTSGRVDLDQIWKNQAVPDMLAQLLHDWIPVVLKSIVDAAHQKSRNVTEWAKSPDCWAVIQNVGISIPDELEVELREGTPLPNVGAFKDGGKVSALTEEEAERQRTVMAMSASNFATMFTQIANHQEDHGMHQGAWMAMTGCISSCQMYAQNGWKKIPSPKMTKQILKAQQFLKDRAPVPAAEQ